MNRAVTYATIGAAVGWLFAQSKIADGWPWKDSDSTVTAAAGAGIGVFISLFNEA